MFRIQSRAAPTREDPRWVAMKQWISFAVPATTDGRNMTGDDFALTAGWGHVGAGGAVMPGQGHAAERAFTPEERAALSHTFPVLGAATFDVCINDRAFEFGAVVSPRSFHESLPPR